MTDKRNVIEPKMSHLNVCNFFIQSDIKSVNKIETNSS